MRVLHAAAGGHDHRAALGCVVVQALHHALVRHIHLRRADDAIAIEVFMLTDDIHIQAQGGKGRVQPLQLLQVVIAVGLGLDLEGVLVVKGQEDGHVRPVVRALHMRQRVRHFAQVGELSETPSGHVGVVDQAVPVHLRADIGRAPAEEHHRVRAMGESLQRIALDHPRLGHAGHGRPAAHAAAELLHDPEGTSLHTAHHVQVEGVGVAFLRIVRQLRGGVIVVGNEVKIRKFLVEIRHVAAEPHIGGHGQAGAVAADDLRLPGGKVDHIVRGEAGVIQHERRVEPRVRVVAPGRLDLIPGGVLPAPDHIAVGPIDILQRAVFRFQPVAELRIAGLTEAEVGLQLVVDLPGNDGLVARIAPGHLLDDPPAVEAHRRMVNAAVSADAGAGGLAVLLDHHRVRVFLIQPQRRAAGGGAQHHADAAIGKQSDGLVQPVKGELALPGLQTAPGVLRQTHQLHAGLLHQIRIRRPQGFIPVLGIVIHADTHLLHFPSMSFSSAHDICSSFLLIPIIPRFAGLFNRNS